MTPSAAGLSCARAVRQTSNRANAGSVRLTFPPVGSDEGYPSAWSRQTIRYDRNPGGPRDVKIFHCCGRHTRDFSEVGTLPKGRQPWRVLESMGRARPDSKKTHTDRRHRTWEC